MLATRIIHRSLSRLTMQGPLTRRASSISRHSKSLPSLPRLPVPDLHKTLRSYLKSLEPFLLADEVRGGSDFKSAYEVRVKLVDDFEHGVGQLCQQRLREFDEDSPHSWLDDNIWLKKAYHEWRAPLIVNSNWWLALADDAVVPSTVRQNTQHSIGYTSWQTRRAAWLVHRILDFKDRLERQEIYPDTTRTGLWFRHAALQSYNTCRVPLRDCDRFAPLPTTSTHTGKILVIVADWFYAVDAIESEGRPYSPAVLEMRLHAIVRDVEMRISKGEQAVPIGVLTTDERDRWADNLRHLLSLSPSNQVVHDTIISSAFALSLDNYNHALPPSLHTDDQDLTAHLHNTRSGHRDHPGHNRWYDKPFTLIVEANTRAGVLGEHSPVDALVPSIVADYAIVQEIDEDAFSDSLDSEPSTKSTDNIDGWERLDWVVDDVIAKECEGAAKRAKCIVDDSDMDELVYTAYGVKWIQDEARLSPDAYIQMALQLAWYRTRGEITATYETVLTRIFHHGRTETVRTMSTDTRTWLLAMADPQCSGQQRAALLRRAAQSHTALTRQAATGRGIDRHLLGLQLMLRPDAGESHPLFEDPLFAKSQTWKLSTSGLSAGYEFRGTGFGSLYHDGYGVNYMPAPDKLRFGIESKYSCAQTSTKLFKDAIASALHDLQTLCISAYPTLPQAHL